MKIPAGGGTPVTLARSDDYFMNLTWSADDRIRYPSRNNDAIRSVSANGGPVDSVEFGAKTWVNRAYGLPEGRLLVSMIAKGKRTIAIREPDGQLRPLIDGWDGRLTPTAHLLFAKADGPTWSLAAVSFDARSASITGTPDVLAADIAVHYATPVDVTAAGDLFYVGGASRSERRVVTIDATGSQRDVALPPAAWVFMQLAPDGRNWRSADGTTAGGASGRWRSRPARSRDSPTATIRSIRSGCPMAGTCCSRSFRWTASRRTRACGP